jgi:uncharacterized membrane protein YccF (DUF307 family)
VRVIGNILWFILAGLWLAIGYLVAGIVMCILIITIPFGVASFRLAGYALWPFGRVVVRKPTAGAASVIGNIIWFLLAGWWLALAQVAFGLVLCITIIGIPFGIASFKMAALAVAPLGKEIVSRDDVRAEEALYGTGYPAAASPS